MNTQANAQAVGDNPSALSQSESRTRGCLFYLARGITALVVLIVALNLLGFVYQRAGEAADRSAYPSPGRMVDVGGYSLHIDCQGEGSPTVILEAGTGGSSLDWLLVQQPIAGTTRVCAYDRQGYGWSEDSAHPRTSQQVAADLHTLLTNAGVEPPYVLVGHSIGGIHAQVFTDEYPDEVVGLVFVDRAPAEYHTALRQTNEEVMASELGAGTLDIAQLVTTIGVARLLNYVPSPVASALSPELQPLYKQSVLQTRYYRSVAEEYAVIRANYNYAAALPPFRDDLPLVALVSDPNISTDPLAAALSESRTAYASRYANARVIVAEGSNHFIQVKRPELVIQSIQDVVEAARTGIRLAR